MQDRIRGGVRACRARRQPPQQSGTTDLHDRTFAPVFELSTAVNEESKPCTVWGATVKIWPRSSHIWRSYDNSCDPGEKQGFFLIRAFLFSKNSKTVKIFISWRQWYLTLANYQNVIIDVMYYTYMLNEHGKFYFCRHWGPTFSRGCFKMGTWSTLQTKTSLTDCWGLFYRWQYDKMTRGTDLWVTRVAGVWI